MRLNLRLSHKGFILISVPLIFEIAFVFALSQLLKKAEYEAWQENHSKEITAHVERLQKQITDGGLACLFYVTTKKSYFVKQIDEMVEELPEERRSLEDLVKDNPHERQEVAKIVELADEAVQLLQEGRRMFEQGGKSFMFANAQEMQETYSTTLKQLLSAIHELVEEEKKTQGLSLEGQIKSHRMVEMALYGGVALNVLLAVVLAFYFNRSTAARLSVLMDNTRKLAKRQKLNAPLEGSDEIGHLDHTFHEMVDALAELDRLKQEFLAMVSHDLRTPLTSIQCILSLLASGALGKMPDEAEEAVNEAEGESTRLIKLVNDLLDMERMEAGRIEIRARNVALSSILERSAAAVHAVAEKADVAIKLARTDLEITADDDRLVQVLVNLLSNAVKFSPAGSSVEIAIEDLPEWVEVKVIDRGRGVPSHLQEAIFEKFKQVEDDDARQKGGTGLGLPICKTIIEAHGGSIGVVSGNGSGSTFWFRLPKVKSQVQSGMI